MSETTEASRFEVGDTVEFKGEPGWGKFVVQDVERDGVDGAEFHRLHVRSERSGRQMTFLEENAVKVQEAASKREIYIGKAEALNNYLYGAIKLAMDDLAATTQGQSPAVDKAFNTLHDAYWSEVPCPADRPQKRDPVADIPATFQMRVIAERMELEGNIERLNTFTGSDTFRSLDLAEQHRLVRQLNLQRQLSSVLAERIAAF